MYGNLASKNKNIDRQIISQQMGKFRSFLRVGTNESNETYLDGSYCAIGHIYQSYMQNYQVFWNQQIAPGGHRQLQIDWDTFIRNFAKAISQHAHYQLNSTQKQFIKTKIDPRQTNQIYKNAFLLFAHTYWDLPSNRNNLFKMKINLTALPKLALLTGSDPQRLLLSCRYQSNNGSNKYLKYEIRQDKLHQLDEKGFEVSDKECKEQGFIAIGGGQSNDIEIEDCYYINKYHLKLICVKVEKQSKKRMIYDEREPRPTIETQWYIRDVARSNRLKYLLDTPWKYAIVKPGMVISIGLTDQIELKIEKVGFDSNSFNIPQSQCEQMISTLNADRINYMGDIDQNIPLKTVIDIDFWEITPKEVEHLYQEGHYYPQIRQNTVKKANNQKQTPTVTFTITNKRTFESKQYVSNRNVFSIGRSKECTYQIEEVTIRKQELMFQFLSNRWTVRCAQKISPLSLQNNVPSVYISSAGNIEQGRNSNRVRLKEGSPYILRGKYFEFSIELKQPKSEQEVF